LLITSFRLEFSCSCDEEADEEEDAILFTVSQWSCACTEILDHWLQGNGRTPGTWKTLLEALRDCPFTQLADDLEEALIDKDV